MNIEEEKKKIRKEIRRRRRELSSKTLSAIDNSLPEFISAIGDKELLGQGHYVLFPENRE